MSVARLGNMIGWCLRERSDMTRRQGYVAAASALMLLVVGWAIFALLPDLLAPSQSDGFGPQSVEDARGAVRTAALQFLGGLVLLIGAIFTALNFRQTRERDEEQRHANDERRGSTAKAKSPSASRVPSTRSGAGNLMFVSVASMRSKGSRMDSAVDHGPIMEVLTAYLHERASWPPADEDADHRPGADIQAALIVVGRRNREHEPEWDTLPLVAQQTVFPSIEYRLNLRHLDLRGADLAGADFCFDDLFGSHLEGAWLKRTRFDIADLSGTHFEGTLIENAFMSGATMHDAHLEGAVLNNVDLSQASLRRAHLQGTDLAETCVTDATLDRATVDSATKFPYDFDEDEHRLNFIEDQDETAAANPSD